MEKLKITSNLAVSENGFLFLPTTGVSFTVNELGKLIISALQDNKELAEIIEVIINEYETDKQTAERDIEDFINQLKNHKILIES